MNRAELERWLKTNKDGVWRLDEFIDEFSKTHNNAMDMIKMFLNSDPDDINFEDEFICLYTPNEENQSTCRIGYDLSLFTLNANDIDMLIESGDFSA